MYSLSSHSSPSLWLRGIYCKCLYFHGCHGLSKFICTKWSVLLTVLYTGWRFLWSHWNRCLYSCWICWFESIWWFASRKYPKGWLPCHGIRFILHLMLLFVSFILTYTMSFFFTSCYCSSFIDSLSFVDTSRHWFFYLTILFNGCILVFPVHSGGSSGSTQACSGKSRFISR